MTLFWSALAAVAMPLAGVVSLAGLIGAIGVPVRVWRRRRREHAAIAERMETAIQRPANCFECRRCKRILFYHPRWGEVCFNCWLELSHYLKQVAG